MNKINYELKLDENGLPYTEPDKSFDSVKEHRLFVFEMVRYMLFQLTNKLDPSKFNDETLNEFNSTISFMNYITEDIRENIKILMEAGGETNLLFPKHNHNIYVKTIKERDSLGSEILFENNIYKKTDGLKVLVKSNKKTYEFENDCWIELK